ncbi:MAG: alpha/beta hydrolase [Oscillospiraceae bacterium]|nr:alpha/beta hydrolase [Oscillospiraceae bacterium]
MAFKRTEGEFPSSSGLANVFYRVWEPENQAVAAMQIVHGMAEHGERYEAFAQALCDAGIAVWCADLPGHGKTTRDAELRGYFGRKNGWKHLRSDVKALTNLMRDHYPLDLPFFLFGHSMGSFIARAYTERYSDDLAGAVFCGTSGSNPVAAAGILAARIIALLRGDTYRSELLDQIGFGHYNDKYPGKPRTKFDWLNTDSAEVDIYIEDKDCGFIFTAAGYLDLLHLLKHVNRGKWFRDSIPHHFPMLLIAGDADPVGDYGKGVQQVARRLREAGRKQTVLQLFPGMRHEILLAPERQLVYDCVIQWIQGVLEKKI